jgi:RNA polymerase sigma factor (sigma-70 family)
MKKPEPNQSCPEPMAYAPGKTVLWNQSWSHIYEHFCDAIRARAAREGLDEHSQQDVLQEAMVALIRAQNGLEPGYDPTKTSFKKWFSVVVHNRIREVRRRARKETYLPIAKEKANEAASTVLPQEVQLPHDFEESEEREWAKARLASAMCKVQEAVSPRNFEIYVALLHEKATPDQLAAKYDMTRGAVDVANFRCKQKINAEVEILKKEWEKLNEIRVQSVKI